MFLVIELFLNVGFDQFFKNGWILIKHSLLKKILYNSTDFSRWKI